MPAAVQQPAQAPRPPELENPFYANNLRSYYLRKQEKANGPLKDLLTGVAMIISVAAAVFSSLTGFSAFFFGAGVYLVLKGLSYFLMNRSAVYTKNREAADAVISPGFLAHALQNPKQLASADSIVTAHKAWLRS